MVSKFESIYAAQILSFPFWPENQFPDPVQRRLLSFLFLPRHSSDHPAHPAFKAPSDLASPHLFPLVAPSSHRRALHPSRAP
jgi:hypothetical protein